MNSIEVCQNMVMRRIPRHANSAAAESTTRAILKRMLGGLYRLNSVWRNGACAKASDFACT